MLSGKDDMGFEDPRSMEIVFLWKIANNILLTGEIFERLGYHLRLGCLLCKDEYRRRPITCSDLVHLLEPSSLRRDWESDWRRFHGVVPRICTGDF